MSVKFSNNAVTTLSAGISAGATSFTVASASTFPTLGASDWTYVSLTSEVVKVTAISGTTFTCDATSGAHSSGATVELRMTAELLDDFVEGTETVTLGDNVKATFGAGNDLQIYHDSANSLLSNLTGELIIRNNSDDKDIYLQSDDSAGGVTTYIQVDGSNGSVNLRHYGTTKLATTSTGIDVTGDSSEGSETPPTIAILDSSNGTWNAAHDSFGNLDFENLDTSGAGSGGVKARISAQVTSTDGAASELGFYHGSGTTLTQGMLLDSTGIDVTGNVAVSGTVDGRDVATDGDELDGILAGSIGRINSPLLDLPLTNSLSMRSGVGSVTFARTTTATYVDRYGVLQTAPIDEPRFEKEGLLVEGASTNFAFPSSSLNWVGYNFTEDVNTSGIYAPDGTETVTKVSTTGSSDPYYYKSTSVGAAMNGKTFTYSIWAWIPSGHSSYADLYFYQTTGGTNGDSINKTITLTTTPTRYEITRKFYDEDVGTSTSIRIDLEQSGALGNSVYIWGAQLEELPFVSSYIPTTSAAVTRGQDVATVSYDNNMMSATQELTVVADMNLPSYNVLNTSPRGWFGIVGETYRYIRTAHNVINGSVAGTGLLALFTISKALNNYCFTSNSTGIISYVDGASVSTGSALTVQRTGATSISLGETGHSSSTKLFGHIKNFKTYDITLTANEIKLLQGA
jgi:hypothetical protein